jgi:hypothetical protein
MVLSSRSSPESVQRLEVQNSNFGMRFFKFGFFKIKAPKNLGSGKRAASEPAARAHVRLLPRQFVRAIQHREHLFVRREAVVEGLNA